MARARTWPSPTPVSGRVVELQALPRQGKLLTWTKARTSQMRRLKHQRWSITFRAPSHLLSPPRTGSGLYRIWKAYFECKAAVDQYILSRLPDLTKKTTFLWVSYYGLNNLVSPMLMPVKIVTIGNYIVT